MPLKKTENKAKAPSGHEALGADAAGRPEGRKLPVAARHETTIVLDGKLLTLAGIVRVLRDHIEDQESRIADLEAERDDIGRMAARLAR